MNTATQKQYDFIKVLQNNREYDPEILEVARKLWKLGEFTKAAASLVIDELKASPIKKVEGTLFRPTPEGMHEWNNSVWKVQRSPESGRLYAKKLVKDGDKYRFEYAPGIVSHLSPDTVMRPEYAAKFGKTYGICANCAKTLTDERSIEAGYGPTCAANNGWPWG